MNACPCCGHLTLEESIYSTYSICPICFWEDDKLQLDNPYLCGGANKICLIEARKNYTEFDATLKKYQHHVRQPRVGE